MTLTRRMRTQARNAAAHAPINPARTRPEFVPESCATIPLNTGGRESVLCLWPSTEKGWANGSYLDANGRPQTFQIETGQILNALEKLRRLERA